MNINQQNLIKALEMGLITFTQYLDLWSLEERRLLRNQKENMSKFNNISEALLKAMREVELHVRVNMAASSLREAVIAKERLGGEPDANYFLLLDTINRLEAMSKELSLRFEDLTNEKDS